ncbi:MAG: hypothetical protein KDI66_22995, partial [Xanthomonadales bacterium]|nr:hypothetical protein [Xanthomonadales bacterium]
TRNDQTFNDKEVTVLKKENALMSFKFQTVYSQNPFPPDTTIYKKGFGWTKKTYMWFDKWTEVRIDGKLVPVD